MAAPEYVPIDTTAAPRIYASPPRRPAPWSATRPGDLIDVGQPIGPMLGTQGPDLGYALRLVNSMVDRIVLADGEHLDDVVATCTALAMRRAAMFGRAPVIHDLTVAFSIWGFLDTAPAELVELRRPLFAETASPHHWAERRRIIDMVPDDVLRRSHTEILAAGAAGWKDHLNL